MRDAAGGWQTFATSNTDGVHTLSVTSTPSTAGGGGGTAPTLTASSNSFNANGTVTAGAVSILFEAATGATITVAGVAVPAGILAISAPEGYLLPSFAYTTTGGNILVRQLRP